MNIISSCSLIAKGEEPFIISRLNDILPKKGINDLVFRHCSMLKNPPKIEKKRVHKEVSRIDDFRLNNQRLHSAFEDLKTEIQSAA
jgi:hypothetical protein